MVGLLTLNSRMYNYGGFLQEMALQDAIKSLGYKCEIIDYDVSQELNTFTLMVSSMCSIRIGRNCHLQAAIMLAVRWIMWQAGIVTWVI